MRKSRLLDALMPRTRQKILGAVLLNPSKAWYLSDLARHLRSSPSSLQRELASLVNAGILRGYKDANRAYFQANRECPVLAELHSLITKTTAVVDVLETALRGFRSQITCAFVYGSVARTEEMSESDVDLMVIGTVGLADLAKPLRRAEGKLARPVNPSLYTPQSFAKKLSAGHHFISGIVDQPKLFIVGNDDVLESVRKEGAR